MSGIERFHNIASILTRSFRIDHEAIEELREIMEAHEGRPVSHDEAETIGRGLVNIAETLANGRTITASRGGTDGQQQG